jgi:hypothetical protein
MISHERETTAYILSRRNQIKSLLPIEYDLWVRHRITDDELLFHGERNFSKAVEGMRISSPPPLPKFI